MKLAWHIVDFGIVSTKFRQYDLQIKSVGDMFIGCINGKTYNTTCSDTMLATETLLINKIDKPTKLAKYARVSTNIGKY